VLFKRLSWAASTPLPSFVVVERMELGVESVVGNVNDSKNEEMK
jgi:hypothetical protein